MKQIQSKKDFVSRVYKFNNPCLVHTHHEDISFGHLSSHCWHVFDIGNDSNHIVLPSIILTRNTLTKKGKQAKEDFNRRKTLMQFKYENWMSDVFGDYYKAMDFSEFIKLNQKSNSIPDGWEEK